MPYYLSMRGFEPFLNKKAWFLPQASGGAIKQPEGLKREQPLNVASLAMTSHGNAEAGEGKNWRPRLGASPG
jgi:hypothetical protein